MINWQINAADIIAILTAAAVMYGRIVKIETKIEPIWRWWNATHGLVTEPTEDLLIERRGKRK